MLASASESNRSTSHQGGCARLFPRHAAYLRRRFEPFHEYLKSAAAGTTHRDRRPCVPPYWHIRLSLSALPGGGVNFTAERGGDALGNGFRGHGDNLVAVSARVI